MKELFRFESRSRVRVQEIGLRDETHVPERTIISGTMLVAGLSTNNRLYRVDELENIARNMVGKPVYYGMKRIYQNGLVKTVHDDASENEVGVVKKTFLNRAKGTIRFVAELYNNLKYPKLRDQVHAGWGVSIGGFVEKANFIRHLGKTVMEIKNMIVQHLALIPPTVSRGFSSARIEKIHEVSMTFTDNKGRVLSSRKMALIISALQKSGYI